MLWATFWVLRQCTWYSARFQEGALSSSGPLYRRLNMRIPILNCRRWQPQYKSASPTGMESRMSSLMIQKAECDAGMRCDTCAGTNRLFSLHLFCTGVSLLTTRPGRKLYLPALCSANLAPTLSECFKNLSVQFWTQVVWI